MSSSKPAVVTSNPEPILCTLAHVGNETGEWERLSGSLLTCAVGQQWGAGLERVGGGGCQAARRPGPVCGEKVTEAPWSLPLKVQRGEIHRQAVAPVKNVSSKPLPHCSSRSAFPIMEGKHAGAEVLQKYSDSRQGRSMALPPPAWVLPSLSTSVRPQLRQRRGVGPQTERN